MTLNSIWKIKSYEYPGQLQQQQQQQKWQFDLIKEWNNIKSEFFKKFLI